MRTWLCGPGYKINRKRVQRLMRQMGLEAFYPKPGTNQPGQGHKISPCLLKGLTINHSNQVWATDLTYIPMERGFMYLIAIMDWYSRRALAWRFSNTMDADFCVDALEQALDRYGAQEIFNSDQGSQLTSDAFTGILKEPAVQISMDSKGCYRNNIFVERLWLSVKCECVYLKVFANAAQLKQELKGYFQRYNSERPHQGLNDNTPDQVYFRKAA